jgi:putative two-component system response regulator
MTKILLVEDDTLLLEVMRSILEGEGFEIFPASNGKQALDLFVGVKPELVISDIMMPEMDGYELLEAIRATPSGVTVPFLFLSARTERGDVSRARMLGVDDYLFKPFDAPELRDPYTAGHLERVRRLALNLAFALNWSNEDIAILEFGAILHDVGKIIVPSLVLKKTGPLNEEEWKLMRKHPEVGAKMLEGVDHLRAAIPYVLYHHEWWNGNGYPRGLKGDEIPREGRLLSIVDAFDAMTTNRPYHSSMSADAGLEELRRNSGIYFDPTMVAAFIKTYKQ